MLLDAIGAASVLAVEEQLQAALDLIRAIKEATVAKKARKR